MGCRVYRVHRWSMRDRFRTLVARVLLIPCNQIKFDHILYAGMIVFKHDEDEILNLMKEDIFSYYILFRRLLHQQYPHTYVHRNSLQVRGNVRLPIWQVVYDVVHNHSQVNLYCYFYNKAFPQNDSL